MCKKVPYIVLVQSHVMRFVQEYVPAIVLAFLGGFLARSDILFYSFMSPNELLHGDYSQGLISPYRLKGCHCANQSS